MAKTAQDEIKLTMSTVQKLMESSTGLMITPPPSPTVAPTVQAKNITITEIM